MKKILSLGTLALAGVLAFATTGCGKEEKPMDPSEFTSASVGSESKYKVVSSDPEKLMAAMAKYKGTYLYVTENPDETLDMAFYFINMEKKGNEYYITRKFTPNKDGSKKQTVLNLERTNRATLYFTSHGYKEIVATEEKVYTAVPAGETAPTFAKNTYYSKTGETYTLLTAAPGDWATTYTAYYTMKTEYKDPKVVDLTTENTPAAAAAIQTVVESLTTDKDNNTTVVLKVVRIDPYV